MSPKTVLYILVSNLPVALFLILLVTALVLTMTIFNITGNYKFVIVNSAAMEPTIKTGSLVLMEKSTSYQKGDIVIFKDPTNLQETLLRRIQAEKKINNNIFYITKGDGEKSFNPAELNQNKVLGKVIKVIPILGSYLSTFKTTRLTITLASIPMILILVHKIFLVFAWAIHFLIIIRIKYLRRKIREHKKRKLGNMFGLAKKGLDLYNFTEAKIIWIKNKKLYRISHK